MAYGDCIVHVAYSLLWTLDVLQPFRDRECRRCVSLPLTRFQAEGEALVESGSAGLQLAVSQGRLRCCDFAGLHISLSCVPTLTLLDHMCI